VLRALPAPTIDQDEVEAEDEELVCKTCGESFADLGDPICPFCGSDDTEPLD
jgi:rubrerythrin